MKERKLKSESESAEAAAVGVHFAPKLINDRSKKSKYSKPIWIYLCNNSLYTTTTTTVLIIYALYI